MNRYQRIWSSPSFAPRAKLVGIPATSYKRSRIQRELLRGARSLRRLGARPRLPSAPIDLLRRRAIGAGLCARPHRLPRLWRTTAPHCRADRPHLSPALSTRRRAPDRAVTAYPLESPTPAKVGLRRITYDSTLHRSRSLLVGSWPPRSPSIPGPSAPTTSPFVCRVGPEPQAQAPREGQVFLRIGGCRIGYSFDEFAKEITPALVWIIHREK